MKKRTVKLCGLVAAVMAGLLLTVSAAASPGSSSLKVGTSFVVEPPMARYIADLDPRELREQVRDWAVRATVTRLGASLDQTAAATYELPPARLPYLDEIYAFEYGRGRRAYLGSRVLLFRDGDDPDPQTTIGRLADRVRRENGAIPARVEVYLVHDQRDEGTIRIERANDITGTELFSQAYGYAEASADSAAGLDAWLAQVDDLTFAQLRGGHLVLGGRRFARTRTTNVTSDDVAALYQAHEQLGAPQAAARSTLQALPRAAQQTVSRTVNLLKAGQRTQAADAFLALTSQVPSMSRGKLDKIVESIFVLAKTPHGPGFSLDPEWLPDPSEPGQPLMLARMRSFAAQPCSEIDVIAKRATDLERAEPDPTRYTSSTRTALRLREALALARTTQSEESICSTLKDFVSKLDGTIQSMIAAARSGSKTALSGYYQLETQLLSVPISDPSRTPARLTFRALQYYAADTKTQCSRYEGTAGTAVGMTMFYTDLLAKIWLSTDHGMLAPTLEVSGFVTVPRIDLSSELKRSIDGNRDTRIWFGPRANGVSRNKATGTSIFFDHAFAHIFAAGSNPEHPGREVLPNEASRRAIGWWDRHYDDVANYEQEYHRLNQIMKWSLVTGALLGSRIARDLEELTPQHELDFDTWMQANRSRLRFTDLLPLSKAVIPGKQCIPILESYDLPGYTGGIQGGVGSASRESLPKVTAVDTTKPLGARLAPAGDLAGNTTGTAIRTAPRRSGRLVLFDKTAGIPTRDARTEVPLGTVRVSFQSGARPGVLEVHAGDPARPIGVIATERKGGGVKMSWRDGTIEQARHHDATPRTLAEADHAARSGDVLGAARVFEASSSTKVATTMLERARAIVIEAAHRRPKLVLDELARVVQSGEPLSPAAREMLVEATNAVGTPHAAEHVEQALAQGIPLASNQGNLVVERGTIILTRDVTEFETTAAVIPPATDLSERGIFLQRQLRLSQDGTIPDLGGQAARWQHRPNVRMSELRDAPVEHPSDEVVETSTGTTFDYIPPRKLGQTGSMQPPIIIRQCDSNHQTPQTDDDC